MTYLLVTLFVDDDVESAAIGSVREALVNAYSDLKLQPSQIVVKTIHPQKLGALSAW